MERNKREGFQRATDVQAWDIMKGMEWPWKHCKNGVNSGNVRGLQNWFKEQGYYVSLRDCMKCASEVKRYNRHKGEFRSRIGTGFKF